MRPRLDIGCTTREEEEMNLFILNMSPFMLCLCKSAACSVTALGSHMFRAHILNP